MTRRRRRARRRSSAARSSERRDSMAEAVADADFAFVAAPVHVAAGRGRRDAGGGGRRTAWSATSARSSGRSCGRSTTRASSAATRWPARETAGVEHARADLFQDATWYLTPTATTQGTAYERLHRLITRLGAWPAAMDPETHDVVMASVSHLPHVLANVLVGQAARVLSAEGERLPATGPSFRDVTRVAGANTPLWRGIYLANADALVGAIDDLVERLQAARELLAAGDGGGDRRLERRRARGPPAAAGAGSRRRRGARAGGARAEPPGDRGGDRARAGPGDDRHRRHGPLSLSRARTARSRCGSAAGRRDRAGRGARARAWGSRWRGREAALRSRGPAARHAAGAGRQVAVAPRGAAGRDVRRPRARHGLPRRRRHALDARRRARAAARWSRRARRAR